jgi:PAT family beta-lactamase induction signal transducer AmpG
MFRYYFTKRMLIMLLMSFSSGLPLALSGSTLQAWYTVSNVSIIAIGFLSLVGQPYTFKFIWAPLMDRYIPPFLGRRRGWIMITQVLLLLAIGAMAFFDPSVHPGYLAAMALVVAFLSSSQDISLDAYRTDLLTANERGPGAALWSNGYRIAMIISGAVALMIAAKWGWKVTYLIMATCMLVGIITTFFSPEPDTDDLAPKTLWVASKEAIADLLSRRYIFYILIFVVIYKLGDAFALSLSSVFYLRHLGFSLDQVAWVGKTFGTLAGVLGILLGGALMVRLTLYRALMSFGWLQALSTLMFLWLAIAGKIMWLFIAAVFLEHLTSGMGTIALFVFLMALCDNRYTATQYALLSAVAALGRIYIGPIAGYTIKASGWPEFFIISFLLGLIGLLLLFSLRHKVDFNAKNIR